jgi:hypothetical protein
MSGIAAYKGPYGETFEGKRKAVTKRKECVLTLERRSAYEGHTRGKPIPSNREEKLIVPGP